MRLDKVVMYRDRKGEWRWRYVRSNGRVMADSGEGYRTKHACKQGAGRVLSLAGYGAAAVWVEQDDGTDVLRVPPWSPQLP